MKLLRGRRNQSSSVFASRRENMLKRKESINLLLRPSNRPDPRAAKDYLEKPGMNWKTRGKKNSRGINRQQRALRIRIIQP